MGEQTKTLEELGDISLSYLNEDNQAVYVTTDGTPFLDGAESYAHSHARMNDLGIAKFVKDGDTYKCVLKPLGMREWEAAPAEAEAPVIPLQPEPIIEEDTLSENQTGTEDAGPLTGEQSQDAPDALTTDVPGADTNQDNTNAPEPISAENNSGKKKGK